MSTSAPFFMKLLYARTSMFKTKMELANTRSIATILRTLTPLRPTQISKTNFVKLVSVKISAMYKPTYKRKQEKPSF